MESESDRIGAVPICQSEYTSPIIKHNRIAASVSRLLRQYNAPIQPPSRSARVALLLRSEEMNLEILPESRQRFAPKFWPNPRGCLSFWPNPAHIICVGPSVLAVRASYETACAPRRSSRLPPRGRPRRFAVQLTRRSRTVPSQTATRMKSGGIHRR
jgi:hypothetical protein